MQKVRGTGAQATQATFDFKDDDQGVTFYTEAPDVEVSGREFEDLTCDRLKVLHAFDRMCAYEQGKAVVFDPSEIRGKIMPEIRNSRLELGIPAPGKHAEYPTLKEEFRRRDGISHFALRLAFCKTRDAREWFLRQEQRLFTLRFDALSPAAQEAFMVRAGIPLKRFDEAQWGEYPTLVDLQKTSHGGMIFTDNGGGQKTMEYEKVFYEMPFFEINPHLIAARKVVIHQGKAFVPSSALKFILTARFKEYLAAGLESAFNALPAALADPRVGGFLRLLQDHGLQLLVASKSGSDAPGEKLSLDNFEEFVMRSFPPCMRRLVEAQRDSKKHLKHAGRLQLRPFLKDCGFTYDESMRWWRQELTKDPTVDITSFEKNYMYDVDHAYGKKGHFQGQNSFGCPKIIGFPSEAAGQVHGCPFKLELPALKQHLHRWKVPETGVAEMEKLINHGKHYQLACIEYFKCGHQGHEGDGVGNSPGDFFRESCKHYVKKKEKESGKSSSKVETTAQPSQQPSQAIAA